MRTLIDRLTSRRTSMALIAFVACVAVIGAIVPQRTNTSAAARAAWQADNPWLANIVGWAGLDRIFSAWWFVGGLALFALSLAIATWRMASSVRTGMRVGSMPRARVHASIADVRARAVREGFRQRGGAGDLIVLERHAWAMWGPTVLHAGLVVAVVAGLVASATTSRAVLDLSVGEARQPGDTYLDVETGIAGSAPELGRAVRLDGIDTRTWPSGDLRSVTATIAVQREDGTWESHRASATTPLRLDGLVLYVQAAEFGEAAFLDIEAPDGEQRRRMEFAFTPAGTVSYADVVVGDDTIEGRWDPSMTRADRPLALRVSSDTSTSPVLLDAGDSVRIGPYAITFAEKGRWARFILVRPTGVTALFVGFAIIAIGSLALYLAVPRRLVLAEVDGEVRYRWSAARLGSAFDDERDRILGDDISERER